MTWPDAFFDALTALSGRSVMPAGLLRLEERIVLDAAAVDTADSHHAGGDAPPVDHADVPEAGTQAGVAPPAPGNEGHADAHQEASPPAGDAPARLVVISSAVDQSAALAAAAREGVHATVYDAEHGGLTGLLEQIRAALGSHAAESIALATHGLEGGGLELASGHPVSLETLHNPELQAFWRGVAELLSPGGRIDLLACDVAAGPNGQALVDALEEMTGANFAASSDPTGNVAQGGNWYLETDHVDAGAVYFDAHELGAFSEHLGPSVADSNPTHNVVGGSAPVVVDPNITVTDPLENNLSGATVRIKSGFVAGQDVLSFTPTAHITGSYDANTGVLLLTGTAAPDEYQTALRSVTYQNTSLTPSTTPREILFTIGATHDGHTYFPQTGHYYDRFGGPATTWAAALASAGSQTLGGLQGYLATVTSGEENTTLAGLIPAIPINKDAWLGGSDAATEGKWYWVTGPEAGTQFWEGGAGGSAVNGMYVAWAGGYPNVAGASGLSLIKSGTVWRDVADGLTREYYIVEYGGLSSDGEGTLAAQVTINVQAPNHAPVLDNSGHMSLASIDEDHRDNGGSTVAHLIASAGGNRITDYNNDPEGIALTRVDTTYGTWQYSLDGGQTWKNVGSVSDTHALLLRDTDLLRFRPNKDWNGTVTDGFTFRAWDQTSGAAGGYTNATVNGGLTAFSSATETGSLVVHPVNDAPVLDNSGTMSLSAMDEDDLHHGGTTVAGLLASAGGQRITDVDSDALQGVAIIGLNSAHGTWQYSIDGGLTWFDVGSVDAAHALLLRDTDLIRFQPDPDWNGAVPDGLRFRAWDRTSGSAGDYADTSVTGGTTAFSTATEVAGIVVHPVNDPPVVAQPLVDQHAAEGSLFRYRFAGDTFHDVDAGDTLRYSATLADGSPLPSWLRFDPATRMFSGTPAQAHVGTLEIMVTATDSHGAAVSDVFALTIADVNFAPVLAKPLVDHAAGPNAAFHYQFASDTFTDPDPGDLLTYGAALADGQPLPAWLTFDPQTRTFSGTPTLGDLGTLLVRVTADDGHGGQTAGVFALTVRLAVTPPTEPTTPQSPGGTGGGVHARPGGGHGGGNAAGGGVTPPAGPSGGAVVPPASPGNEAPGESPAGPGESGAGGSTSGGGGQAGGEGPGAPAAGPPAGGVAVAGATPAGGDGHGPAAGLAHRRDEEMELAPVELSTQVQAAMFRDDLLEDPGVPVEFRETWHTILGAYADSGEELAAYLESAFRTVTESACVHQAADAALAALNDELALAAGAGSRLDARALTDALNQARQQVRVASAELEAAIQAAAQAGRAEQFDRVLEDVISAALQRLMMANERLYVESQAVGATAALLRSARLDAGHEPPPTDLTLAAEQARDAAQTEIAELRKSWDRVAQDVFSAFVARLVAQQAGGGPSALPGSGG